MGRNKLLSQSTSKGFFFLSDQDGGEKGADLFPSCPAEIISVLCCS